MIPHFQYTLASPHSPYSGYITLGEEKIHRVENVRAFYNALGYSEEVKRSGILPEEFIWFEYHKDGSKKSEVCLQIKIIQYLREHSPIFNEKYAAQSENWIANCMEKWTDNSSECKDCDQPKSIIRQAEAQ